jgi:hypothetical protein
MNVAFEIIILEAQKCFWPLIRCLFCSIFIECVDGSGILEWNTANDTLVKMHTTFNGVVTGAPADDMIFVGNEANSLAVMLQPGGELLEPSIASI